MIFEGNGIRKSVCEILNNLPRRRFGMINCTLLCANFTPDWILCLYWWPSSIEIDSGPKTQKDPPTFTWWSKFPAQKVAFPIFLLCDVKTPPCTCFRIARFMNHSVLDYKYGWVKRMYFNLHGTCIKQHKAEITFWPSMIFDFTWTHLQPIWFLWRSENLSRVVVHSFQSVWLCPCAKNAKGRIMWAARCGAVK